MFRVAVATAVVAAGLMASVAARQQSAGRMAQAAQNFLSALSPEQRQQALFEYSSAERQRWHFIPNEMFHRKGISFRTMSAAQKDKAHALLKSGLSQKGYSTAAAIIQLEDVLRAIENSPRFARSPLDYQFSIFGTPSGSGTWGWRVEGHHLSLHFAVSGGRVIATSPTFTGANPAEVRDGPQKGTRVLAPLEDLGRAVVDGLTDQQRTTALVSDEAPTDIVSGNKNNIGPLTPAGLAMAKMTPPQRDSLMRLIGAYTSLMADDLAAERTARFTAAGRDAITFAWAGPTTKGAKHYYRIQGPTFLVEYDNTQNDGNHIHAVWRDFQGDFGRDLLREHLAADHAR
jgi:hypothetical protein